MAEQMRFTVGDRVRVVELGVAGRIVEVVADHELVIVDLHGQPDRLAVSPEALEHLD